MSRDKTDQPSNPDNQKDEDAVAFLQGLFELARNGGTGPLNVMLDAGVPVDIRTNNGETLLMLACQNGHTETARMLLDREADPNLPDHQSQTPLMVATMAERTDLVECLLEAGADQ
ncbi:ankyrin repeat domain-containing protein [Marinobacter halotolerans]|uniref:ankyrin repeat domain-containing protein n=1 Tax=Marinobacter halotolerans TaxID=1569211 RepID=UPI001248A388|nr:ankyrin repeat domain-containing protein [Marinobacter halotolerans]